MMTETMLPPAYNIFLQKKVKGYRTFALFTVDEILPHIYTARKVKEENPSGAYMVDLAGHRFSIWSDRILTYSKGLECVFCKEIRIECFALQSNSGGKHINAWGRYPNGHLGMITSDHIIAVGAGGDKEGLHNRQPACEKCNIRKGVLAHDKFVALREQYGDHIPLEAGANAGYRERYHGKDSRGVRRGKRRLTRRYKRFRDWYKELVGETIAPEQITKLIFPLTHNSRIHELITDEGLKTKWPMTMKQINILGRSVDVAKHCIPELKRLETMALSS